MKGLFHRFNPTAPVAMVLIAAAFMLVAADRPESPKVSAYAPADVLAGQLDYYAGRLAGALEAKDDYSETNQQRVRKDANTLIVLLQALGTHDEENAFQGSAGKLIPLAKAVAEAHADYDGAKAANDKLAAGLQEKGQKNSELAWEKVARQSQLMKQVSTLNASIRRSVRRESSFGRYAEKTAGYAATMAVIAQSALFDTHEVKNPADLDKWYKFTAEWRDAAGSLGSAASKKDFKMAQQAVDRMLKSCDDCHAVFRPDE